MECRKLSDLIRQDNGFLHSRWVYFATTETGQETASAFANAYCSATGNRHLPEDFDNMMVPNVLCEVLGVNLLSININGISVWLQVWYWNDYYQLSFTQIADHLQQVGL
jgi:hypothetical protein